MVLKKKAGKEVEVQEGWIGHILPFDLVQDTLLKNEYKSVKEKENRLSEIPSEYEEIIESMSEEEKDSPILNDDATAFVSKEVSKKIKAKKIYITRGGSCICSHTGPEILAISSSY